MLDVILQGNDTGVLRKMEWRQKYDHEEFYPLTVQGEIVTVRQVQEGEEIAIGTGSAVWPAAVVLSKFLERHEDILRDKIVLDLGSGTGILGIAANIMGAAKVVCTDVEEVQELLRENIHTAGVEDVTAEVYYWGQDPLPGVHPNVILVSDCLLPKLYPMEPLIKALDIWISASLSTGVVPCVYMSTEHRIYPYLDPWERFKLLASMKGFQVDVIPSAEYDQAYTLDDDVQVCTY